MTGTGYTLITGASGFIGNAFARRLSQDRPVVCLSRKRPQGDLISVQGEFHAPDDLGRLDGYGLDCVVHLAAVTGGCSEEGGLGVNVLGTRRLLRYALDRGCRKFVLASSIAAVGCLDPDFLPLRLPIPDDHPCLARDAYGLSKAMVEDLTRYFQRQVPGSDFLHLRLGAVAAASAPVYDAASPPDMPFVGLGHVLLGDVLRALDLSVRAPVRPGVRVFNVVGPDANCSDPVSVVLRAALGARAAGLDLSWYDRPGHAYDALYAMDRIAQEIGFSPRLSTRSGEGE